MEDLSCNFIFCDHHMRPLLHTNTNTLHGDPDQGLQPAGKGGIYIYIYGSFLQEFNITCLSRGRLLGISDCCEHWLLNLKGGAIFCNITGSKITVFKH